MRAYRIKNLERDRALRQEQGRRYWLEHKEEILAKRKAKPRTDRVREYYRGYSKRYRAKHPEKSAAAQKKYNLKNPGRSQKIRQRMQEVRAGRVRPDKCEICGADETGRGRQGNGRIAFDHSHQTNAFRGWICSHCNKALGFARDNPDILRKMIAYLERAHQ
jgi:ribosomal protein L37AE/L43A